MHFVLHNDALAPRCTEPDTLLFTHEHPENVCVQRKPTIFFYSLNLVELWFHKTRSHCEATTYDHTDGLIYAYACFNTPSLCKWMCDAFVVMSMVFAYVHSRAPILNRVIVEFVYLCTDPCVQCVQFAMRKCHIFRCSTIKWIDVALFRSFIHM